MVGGKLKFFKRISYGDIVFEFFVLLVVTLLGIACLYPILYVFSVSISDPRAAMAGRVKVLPVGFSLDAYKRVLETPLIWTYYYNTVWYTVVGTALNLVATVLLAYPLSKRSFVLKGPISFIVVFTMFFGGGLIPTFLLVNSLGLYGTRWVMPLIGLVNTFNMIIARTFFQSLPEELFECARIEGASEFRILVKIVLPLSTAIIAVLALYYGVGHWNTYFAALIYLPNVELQPIQVLLRRVVLQNSMEVFNPGALARSTGTVSMQVKYAVIFFAMFPVLCLYPFLQKYFVKGVMIGALKG
jgi:putative aldouronate transport system permease protein